MVRVYDEILERARPQIKLLFWLLYVVVLLFAIRQITPLIAWVAHILQPFMVALVVAYIFHPIVSFVQKELRLGRVAGILVLAATIALVIVGLLFWLVPVLYEQLVSSFQGISKGISNLLRQYSPKFLDPQAQNELRARLTQSWGEIENMIRTSFGQAGAAIKPISGSMATIKSFAGGVLGGVSSVLAFIATTAFILIVAFYFLADMDDIPRVIRKLLPEGHRERIWEIMLKANRTVGGFLRGQLIASLIIGALTSILLFFIGMRQYAILVGCFAALMSLIPYLGSVAGATPSVIWVLTTGQLTNWSDRGLHLLYLAAGFVLIQAFDGLVSQPFIVGKRASLHPLFVMLALAVGSKGGIAGMIMAVPAACIVKVLWVELFWKHRTDKRVSDGMAAAEPKME